ncbi:LexA family transcriptional regulator [Hymenobacter metallicola]|uniref:Helix-turn-helix domain-containing protein n=1 Tax=Hymenobacter metallicola TaxID=2563114 RepID=A0A4Z0Q0E1_9BACT|nr:helix-turn-helix domain-containing protein [Hymenobacter metallicola]TGE23498.1 helix-turn-helix domain-containing protein [Hymenobacter metallicola]
MPTVPPQTKSNQATRLAELRRASGMSQREVADSINKLGVKISYPRIGAYEADKDIQIKMPVLKALAKVYKTTIEYIERGETDPPKPSGANTEAQPVTSGLGGRIMGALQFMEYVSLPFIAYTAFGSFAENCRDPHYEEFRFVPVLKRPGLDYDNAVVIEVRGNSMAPRYPDQSCHVARPISDGNWQYATGVHGLSLRNNMFIIKRIISNKDGNIILSSDATSEQMEITLGDINCMWKIGEAAYMPSED